MPNYAAPHFVAPVEALPSHALPLRLQPAARPSTDLQHPIQYPSLDGSGDAVHSSATATTRIMLPRAAPSLSNICSVCSVRNT